MRPLSTPEGSDQPLARYWAKRDFSATAEPRGTPGARGQALSYVMQKHAASRLHYDFRLELDGVLLSWAVPKGPSFDPTEKRMAVRVEDHPLEYGSFEGTIPPKQYGAGSVIVWDNGTWEPVGDPHEGLAKGKLVFRLHGQKLAGLWELISIAKGGERQPPWLLFKKRDEHARPKADYDVLTALPDSVVAKPLRQPSFPAQPRRRQRDTTAQVEARSGSAPVPKAVKAALPDRLKPQLATLATVVPSRGEWLYEAKFDGYRLLVRFARGKPVLYTRGGHDWTDRLPLLAQDLKRLGLESGWLDGEIVVLGDDGAPDFNALQNAFDSKDRNAEVVLFVFDLPYLDGYDLRELPLVDRRALLKALLDEKATQRIRFSEAFDTDAASIVAAACRLGLEGVIAKRADSTYVCRRSDNWLKLKCRLRQEFVVCGYTDRSDGSPQIGSLLLGVYGDDGELRPAGSVGTGWSASEANSLRTRLRALEVPTPPYAGGAPRPGRWSRRIQGSEHWLKPQVVAEVDFAEWTPDGQVRHASFVGLRSDKPASEVTREQALPTAAPQRNTAAMSRGSSTRVTHGARVIDPSTGLTKIDLVRYYESVADWMLPHLSGRPVSLVRGPTGVTGELFFQKHDDKLSIPGLKELDQRVWPGHPALLEVPSGQALASCAQMNVIELHTWNSRSKRIDKPDRMVFDLDPGEGTSWQHVQDAAYLVRSLLQELALESWLKTSGGKGLHVVVPLAARWDYATVKDLSRAVVLHLAQTIPGRFVARSGASNRIGKLFVDYLRNGHGATTACAYSARARPGLGVSMPVAWDDLRSLKSGSQWTISTAREHLSFQREDPWRGYWSAKQSISRAQQALAR